VWICLTNIKAVKLWSVDWFCMMLLQQCKRRGVIDVILLWRHSSLVFTSRIKWPIFCLFVVVFGIFDPINVVSHWSYPNRHILAWFRMLWAILRQNPSMGHFTRRFRENKCVCVCVLYFTYLPRRSLTPLHPICTNFGLRIRFVKAINWAKFYRNRSRRFDSVRGRSLTIPIGLRCRR